MDKTEFLWFVGWISFCALALGVVRGGKVGDLDDEPEPLGWEQGPQNGP